MLPNVGDDEIMKNTGKEDSSKVFGIEYILEKRLRLLRLLEDHVENGDLKAIELYDRILTEMREDLRNKEDGDNWFRTIAEMIEDE